VGIDELALQAEGGQLEARLEHYLRHVRLVNPLLGLIRRDALLKTRLIGAFTSSDKVLAAELLMLGEFLELPEVLFHRRIHAEGSRAANRSTRDLRAWFDPDQRNARQILSVDRRLTLEYVRSACRMPIAFRDRLRCLRVITRVRVGSRSRRAIHRYARGLRQWLAQAW
jgi:hypothetical protein